MHRQKRDKPKSHRPSRQSPTFRFLQQRNSIITSVIRSGTFFIFFYFFYFFFPSFPRLCPSQPQWRKSVDHTSGRVRDCPPAVPTTNSVGNGGMGKQGSWCSLLRIRRRDGRLGWPPRRLGRPPNSPASDGAVGGLRCAFGAQWTGLRCALGCEQWTRTRLAPPSIISRRVYPQASRPGICVGFLS